MGVVDTSPCTVSVPWCCRLRCFLGNVMQPLAADVAATSQGCESQVGTTRMVWLQSILISADEADGGKYVITFIIPN